jgi:hypothetical protein
VGVGAARLVDGQADHQRRARQVLGVRTAARQRHAQGAVAHHHEPPRLAVARRTGPAGRLDHRGDVLGGNGVGEEAARCPGGSVDDVRSSVAWSVVPVEATLPL